MTTPTPMDMLAQWNDRLTVLADAIQAKAPLALTAIRVEAAAYLTSTLSGGAVTAAAFFIGRWCARRMLAARDDDMDILSLMGIILCGIVGASSSIYVLIQLFDPWNWVSLFYPELWLARRIVFGGK